MRRADVTRRELILAIPALSLLAACKERDGDSPGPEGERRELVVFAAASLTDAFGAVAEDFERANPRIDVKLNFAGSQSLRAQIENGALPQVFASANRAHMVALERAGLVDEPRIFATNRLVVVVPRDNPAGIERFEDLVKAERLVLAGDHVPAGIYAGRALASVGEGFAEAVRARVVSRENNVRQTLQKVVLGEADAAIVYASDAHAARGDVKVVPIDDAHEVVASYPVATVAGAPHGRLGELFVAHLLGPTGQAQLAAQGLEPGGDAGLR